MRESAPVAIDITMSLDGFVTAPNEGPGRGLGDDGEVPALLGVRPAMDLRRQASPTAGGGSSPFGPCAVVTHRVDEQPDPASGFESVDGVEAGIARAHAIAGDEYVAIGGGASIAQPALQADVRR
jgi:hypothetical protein